MLRRGIPCVSREAHGARTPLREPLSNLWSSHAVSRWNMEETVRAHGWATIVKAVPFPGVFSTRATDFWPAGWCRSNNTAALEKAHVRDAGPMCAPEVPERFPADACVHVTRRHEDTPSWTRGKRTRSCISYRRTRARIVPIPGTACRRDSVWAWWCFAVLTMVHSRSLRLWS